jgi:hypothetical protein
MARSRGRREAIEVAARQLRELQKAQHDEIAAAQRALRDAEKDHAKTIEDSKRELRTAMSAWPIAAYGHEVILFEDRLSTPGGNRALTPSLRARVEEAQGDHHGLRHHLALVIEEPGWAETIRFPRRDEAQVRELARKIETAAREAELALEERRGDVRAAEQEIADAEADRDGIEETRILVNRLGELCEPNEDVLDMAPAISAGHDGVLVATDRRLLFVALRRSLSFPYEEISSVATKGRLFSTRLSVSTPEGKGVFSGLKHEHARAIADVVRERIATREPPRALA